MRVVVREGFHCIVKYITGVFLSESRLLINKYTNIAPNLVKTIQGALHVHVVDIM